MRRFYITLAGLFLVALAWELAGQSRQTVYDSRWSIGTNNPDADINAYIHGKVLIQRNSNSGPPVLTLRDTTSAGSGANTIFAIKQPSTGFTNIAFTSDGRGLLAASLLIGATNDPTGVPAGIGLRMVGTATAVFDHLIGVGTNSPEATIEVFSENVNSALKITGPHGTSLQVNTNNSVGINTNGGFYNLGVVQSVATNPAVGIYDTNGSPRWRLGTFTGDTSYGGIWGGSAVPTAANYTMRSDGANATVLNNPAAIQYRIADVNQWTLTSASLSPQANVSEDFGTSALRIREIFTQSASLSGTGLVNILVVTNGALIANANATGTKPNLEIPRAMVNSDMNVWQDASILLTNSGAGHAMIQMWLNGAFRGGVRADSAGNNNWHAGVGGYHAFYNSPAGGSRAVNIFTNGIMGIGVGAGVAPKDQLEVVGWTRHTNGGSRFFNLASNPAVSNSQAQVYGDTNIATAAVALKVMDGSATVYVLTAAVTNSFSGSATLDFASQTVGAVEDLPITVTGAADGDPVSIAVPVASTTGIIGSFTGFASNGIVFVRFVSTGTAQNPGSGTFKALVHKIR